jgi:GxxExxY protein
MFTPLSSQIESLGAEIVDSAFTVHTTFGPGLLESVYELCMIRELEIRGIQVKSQVPFPLTYQGHQLPSGFRLDMLVDNTIVVEVKAVEGLLPVHRAQVMTYLKLAEKELGYLINFNVPVIKDGIKRVRP